jgi:hypothetical protein
MPIVQTVSRCDFHDAFHAFGRSEQFSADARNALFDHLENLSNDIGHALTLDVVALCCEWSEYASACDAAREYGLDIDNERAASDWLIERTTVLDAGGGGVVIEQF